MKENSLPKILIVGATNVGKSQLFNRLIRDKHAIVLNRNAITRDLIQRKVKLIKSKEVILIDSGGYSDSLENQFQAEVNKLLISQLSKASIVIFVFSKVEGIRIIEHKLSKLVHKNSNCPVVLVANKIDSKKGDDEWEKYATALGFGEPVLISAEHDINIIELIDKLDKYLDYSYPSKIEKQIASIEGEKVVLDPIKLGIIGKVNVGKSSLVNALLSTDAIIVSPIAGTTVDLVEYSISYRGATYLLIDSPGWKKMKKEGVRNEKLDHLSLVRAKKAIKFTDILLFVVDISLPLDYLDDKVAKQIFESNLPAVIVVNKWDLLEYSSNVNQEKYEKMLRERFYYLIWAPIVFVSAKYSKRLDSIFKALEKIKKERTRLFSRAELSSFLGRANLFLAGASKNILLNQMIQVKSSIPTFVVQCSNPNNLNTRQMRLLETQFRNNFSLVYSPITIFYKKD